MYLQTESYNETEFAECTTEMLGVEVIQVAKSGKRLDTLFHGGITLSLTQNIMNIYLEKNFEIK